MKKHVTKKVAVRSTNHVDATAHLRKLGANSSKSIHVTVTV